MKKLLIATGVCMVSVVGFFAGKAATKYTLVNLSYFTSGGHCKQFAVSNAFTTGAGAGSTIVTSAGNTPTFYKGSTCSQATQGGIYLRPSF